MTRLHGKGKPMRIAQIAPLAESVPPKLYGGTERAVAWLVDELTEVGHEVTLFAERGFHDRRSTQRRLPPGPSTWSSSCRSHAVQAALIEEVIARAVGMPVQIAAP